MKENLKMSCFLHSFMHSFVFACPCSPKICVCTNWLYICQPSKLHNCFMHWCYVICVGGICLPVLPALSEIWKGGQCQGPPYGVTTEGTPFISFSCSSAHYLRNTNCCSTSVTTLLLWAKETTNMDVIVIWSLKQLVKVVWDTFAHISCCSVNADI